MKNIFALFLQLLTIPCFAQSDLSDSKIIISGGGGMLFYSHYGTSFGINFGLGVRVNPGLYVGVDSGVGFLSNIQVVSVTATDYKTHTINNSDATIIPILGTIFYRTPIAKSLTVKQLIGASLGPTVKIQTLPSSTASATTTTDIHFQFLLRPGIEIKASEQVGFLFETKFGVLKTGFIFMPQVNVCIGF